MTSSPQASTQVYSFPNSHWNFLSPPSSLSSRLPPNFIPSADHHFWRAGSLVSPKSHRLLRSDIDSLKKTRSCQFKTFAEDFLSAKCCSSNQVSGNPEISLDSSISQVERQIFSKARRGQLLERRAATGDNFFSCKSKTIYPVFESYGKALESTGLVSLDVHCDQLFHVRGNPRESWIVVAVYRRLLFDRTDLLELVQHILVLLSGRYLVRFRLFWWGAIGFCWSLFPSSSPSTWMISLRSSLATSSRLLPRVEPSLPSSSFILRASPNPVKPNFGRTTRLNSNFYSTMTSLPKQMKTLQIHKQGGYEVLEIHEIPVPEPKEGEVLIKTEVSASGTYKMIRLEQQILAKTQRPPLVGDPSWLCYMSSLKDECWAKDEEQQRCRIRAHLLTIFLSSSNLSLHLSVRWSQLHRHLSKKRWAQHLPTFAFTLYSLFRNH